MEARPLRVDDFDFELPPELIADRAVEPRDASRLLVLDRGQAEVGHHRFNSLGQFLRAGDLLVINDTRVMPHRLFGRRASGGRVECLILERHGDLARGYVKPARKIHIDLAAPVGVLMEGGALTLWPLEDLGGGMFRFRLEAADGTVDEALEQVGRAPLPPYIRRDGTEDRMVDRGRYQTVYAAQPGAVAAPTAGLHFTPELLASLAAAGVETARVTLHVGEGTFAPVRVDAVEDHRMHEEEYVLPDETAAAIAATRARGGRVVAVGTTSARTLETCAVPLPTLSEPTESGPSDGAPSGREWGVRPGRGRSGIFIHPGVEVRVVDALITNFHLPRSTLVMLVAALVGRERLLEVYAQAIAERYRFYSFGDAMLIV